MDIAAEMSYPTPVVNSTLLPMLLLSLIRQKHTPDTARTVSTDYDYVIVGAGSAGSVLASRLSEKPCISVLLLEAGPPPPLLTEVPGIARFFWNTNIDWAYVTAPQKYSADALNNRQVPWPSGRTLGGSSVLNGMLYVRGNRKNYDDWAAEGAHGWSYKDVYPYFKEMEDNRDPEYVANGFHGVGGFETVHRPRYQSEIKDPIFEAAENLGYRVVDPNGARQTGFYDAQATMRAGQRCSTAKAYLVPAENRTNLDILPNAMVTKVIIKKQRAVGVRFDFQGVSYEVSARREVIMSAGAINSAKLLMLSGIGPRKELERYKIPVVAELPVGQNLQDHSGSLVNFVLNPNIQPYLGKLASSGNIAQYIQNRTGPLGSAEMLSAMAFLSDGHPKPKKDSPNFELYFAESTAELGRQIGVTPETYARLFAPYEGRPMYTCLAHMLQPRSRGTVTLQSTDPYNPPIIDPNYYEDPKDIQDVVDGLKVCLRIGNSATLSRVGSTPIQDPIPACERFVGDQDMYLWCVAKSLIVTLSHPVGTARMGDPKDPRTVVDPQLRVKHIKGLRVIDASIMPIIPSGNTNIPTIMIAEKASDIIKKNIKCRSKGKERGEKEEPEKEYSEVLKRVKRSSSEKSEDQPWDEKLPESKWVDFSPTKKQSSSEKSEDQPWDEKLPESKWVDFSPTKKQSSSEKSEDQPWDEKLPESKWVEFSPTNFEPTKNSFKESDAKVWNKEAPNVVPWNQELIQAFIPSQTFASNVNRPNDIPPEFNIPGNQQQFNRPTSQQEFNRPANQQQFNRPANQQQSNRPDTQQQSNRPANQQESSISANQQQFNGPANQVQQNQMQQNSPAGIQIQGVIPLKFKNLQLEFSKTLRKLPGNTKKFNKRPKFQQTPPEQSASPQPITPANFQPSQQQTFPPFPNVLGNTRPLSQQQPTPLLPNQPPNGRPPFNPAANQQNQIFSNCDRAFCVSLSRFMQCQEGNNCRRRIEFASLIYGILCS